FCTYHPHTTALYVPPYSPLTPPQPTPTLFPYTTLFRSLFHRTQGREEAHGEKVEQVGADTDLLARMNQPAVVAQLEGFVQRDAQDRKSTRLNSSHGSISYAVFCLKKKKKKTRMNS